jgi:hypothetical protein
MFMYCPHFPDFQIPAEQKRSAAERSTPEKRTRPLLQEGVSLSFRLRDSASLPCTFGTRTPLCGLLQSSSANSLAHAILLTSSVFGWAECSTGKPEMQEAARDFGDLTEK